VSGPRGQRTIDAGCRPFMTEWSFIAIRVSGVQYIRTPDSPLPHMHDPSTGIRVDNLCGYRLHCGL
jgi:hypothetical protein